MTALRRDVRAPTESIPWPIRATWAIADPEARVTALSALINDERQPNFVRIAAAEELQLLAQDVWHDDPNEGCA